MWTMPATTDWGVDTAVIAGLVFEPPDWLDGAAGLDGPPDPPVVIKMLAD